VAIGCYKPQYVPASFKGIPFEAEETTSEHGRRGAEGEFPFSENTAYEDMGRKIRRYTITGRLVTNEHIAHADALIAACEAPGPGLLLHPTRGALMVACTRLSVKDDPTNEQGVTYVDLEFVEASSVATGFLSGVLLGIGGLSLFAALEASFTVSFSVDTVDYFDVPNVIATAGEAAGAIRDEFRRVVPRMAGRKKWYSLAALDNLVNDPASMRSGRAAYEAFDRSTKTLANATSGQAKYDAFRSIANKMAQTSPLYGQGGIAQDAVYSTVRMMAVVNMTRAAMELDIVTLDDALKNYDSVSAVISQEIAAARLACDHALYLELRKFQTEAQTALLNKAYKLPALIEYNFSGGVHSLVAAHEIFGDAKRFAEIEKRNPNMWPFSMGPRITATRV
jgi:prophage DNA circulation protein